MRRNLRLRHLGSAIVSLVLGLATIVACGQGSDETDSSVGFDGVYHADPEGVIGAIAFANGEDYMLMSSSCYEMECTEFGTFVYDDAAQVLTLTDAKTGQAKTLPVSDITTEPYDVEDTLDTLDSLVDRDASLVDAAKDGSSMVDGGQRLVDGGDGGIDAGQRLLKKKKPSKLVGSAKVGKQKASKAKGGGSKKGGSSGGGSSGGKSSGGGSSGGGSSGGGSSGGGSSSSGGKTSSSGGSSGGGSSSSSGGSSGGGSSSSSGGSSGGGSSSSSGGAKVTVDAGDAGDGGVVIVVGGDPVCILTVPTAKSSLADVLAYFVRCPNGIRGL